MQKGNLQLRVGFANEGWVNRAPLFPSTLNVSPGWGTFVGALVIGLVGGAAAWVFTKAVYGAEDVAEIYLSLGELLAACD